MGKNIVLLGTAPASMALAPFGGNWEIWACSPGTYGLGKNVDKFFELHRWETNQEWFSDGYQKFLREFKGDVIMTEMVDDIPNCKLLKHEKLIKQYGPYFFTSSLAWMCAMAINEKPDKIAFYGVDMAAKTEYENQRLGCQYFASLAKARGIEVGVPPESDLFRPAPLYGVCEQSHAWIKSTVRARELSGRLRVLEEDTKSNLQQISFIQGAMDDQDWHLHSFIGSVDSLGKEFCEPPLIPALVDLPSPGDRGNGEDIDVPWMDDLPLVETIEIKNDDTSHAPYLGTAEPPLLDTVPFGHAQIKAPPKKKRGRPRKSK